MFSNLPFPVQNTLYTMQVTFLVIRWYHHSMQRRRGFSSWSRPRDSTIANVGQDIAIPNVVTKTSLSICGLKSQTKGATGIICSCTRVAANMNCCESYQQLLRLNWSNSSFVGLKPVTLFGPPMLWHRRPFPVALFVCRVVYWAKRCKIGL